MKTYFPNNMEIRPFTDDDRYEVATLIRLILEEHGLTSQVGSLTSDIAKLSKRYEGEGAGFWVLLDEGKVIGTVGIRPQGEYTAEIDKFFLSSKYRGRGIGRNLLQFIEDYAEKKGIRRLFISCSKRFVRSRGFFQSANYRVLGDTSDQADNLYEKEID